jgi:hypothetical protein
MRRKPPGQELVSAIQRLQIFSAALVERLNIQHFQAKGIDIQTPGTTVFHEPREQRVLEYMLQISKVIPSQLDGSRFPSTLLLLLWLAERRVSELGYLLEGEVGLPYPTPGSHRRLEHRTSPSSGVSPKKKKSGWLDEFRTVLIENPEFIKGQLLQQGA